LQKWIDCDIINDTSNAAGFSPHLFSRLRNADGSF